MILRVNKQIYKEARNVLYADNQFVLNISTAQASLAALHQRSRSQIKHIELTIPSHHEILEKFAEVVRLSLRYCWQLKTFVVKLPFQIPGQNDDGTMSSSGGTNVYANAFNILRWLPRGCEVTLEGNVCEDIRRVVGDCARMAATLDPVTILKVSHPFFSHTDFASMHSLLMLDASSSMRPSGCNLND